MGEEQQRKKRNYPLLFAKGLAMGAADVVPGVSGGTIAFISGIYDELLETLRGLNPGKLHWLFREGPGGFWRRINGTFLLVLFAGILTSIFSLARLVVFCLENYPLLLWSFFFGLIVASIIYVTRDQPRWGVIQLIALLAGAGLAALSAFSPPLTFGITPLSIFLSGMLAICAMILPGISGSFILLLIGMYPVMIEAVSRVDLALLSIFACGALVGLLLFSHVLSWLLRHHRASTLSLLIGFLVGSLTVLWPWRIVADMDSVSAAEGPVRQLLMPWVYSAQVGDPQLTACVVMMVAGVVLVLSLEYLGGYFREMRN